MKTSFYVGRHPISPNGRCFLIAEVAQAHDGSLGMAHAFIDAVADAGADAVKFQTHIADAESSSREPFRVSLSGQDASRFEYWRRMEFSEHGWRSLAAHAAERGLVFLSSPFSIEAVELLVRIGVPAWKIPSGEVTNTPLLERIVETGLPLLVSTGMSDFREVDQLVACLPSETPLLLFQSTSAYPCPPERLCLDAVAEMRERYGCPSGLSDHSGTIYAGLACVLTGLDALEVHVTFSRSMFGPDVPASLTFEELKLLVQGIRFIERARESRLTKGDIAADLAGVRSIFEHSIAARTDLPRGTALRFEHLAFKKPGGGIPASEYHNLIGRTLVRDLKRDDPITNGDLK